VFTGLVQDVGRLERATGDAPRRLVVRTALPVAQFAQGESVSVNGVCLTVVAIEGQSFAVEAAAETLAATTLRAWHPGAALNLERALAVGDRLGGHLVLGHVDGVGRIVSVRDEASGRWVEVAAPPAVVPFLLPKGSVTIDGVSLTINRVDGERFEVFLIPETLRRTALAGAGAGAAVNLEADILGKYVARLLGQTQALPALSEATLRAAGFA
jgi:riboflavin synthase